MEGPLTLGLAKLAYREHVGWRAGGAALFVLAGVLIATEFQIHAPQTLFGTFLIGLATFAWAVDNTVSRKLADIDPLVVVAGKGFLGASAAMVGALVLRHAWPNPINTLTLLLVGALGFGFSLVLYLRAQRIIGAMRTASVFSVAPFIGSGVALAMGATWPGWHFAIAVIFIAMGVWLHASERHEHAHTHEVLEHEHQHTHDDGHHIHTHEPGYADAEPHSHMHYHGPQTHHHPHSEDIHHRHSHATIAGSKPHE
jgi:drug/metabolite transporter (DMT)-like permease